MMRPGYATVFCAFVFSTFACIVHADSLTEARISPQELKWEKLSTGVERANIAGDDKKAGLYVYRIRFPAGSRVTPHFHPDERVGTVVSGTLYVGYGLEFHEAAMKALPPGSSWTEPNASGVQSLVWRKCWEATHADQWKQKLIAYNIEDCAALKKVRASGKNEWFGTGRAAW